MELRWWECWYRAQDSHSIGGPFGRLLKALDQMSDMFSILCDSIFRTVVEKVEVVAQMVPRLTSRVLFCVVI
jgi:hypothetical protein